MRRGGCCLLDLGWTATAKLGSGGDASASPGHVQQHVQQAPPGAVTPKRLSTSEFRYSRVYVILTIGTENGTAA